MQVVAPSENEMVEDGESPPFRSPRTEMSSELPTKKTMHALINLEMEALQKQI